MQKIRDKKENKKEIEDIVWEGERKGYYAHCSLPSFLSFG